MKQLNFFKLLGLFALMLVVGCKAEKYDDPLASVYQTQWSGTWSYSQTSREVILLAFDSDTTGTFSYKNERGEAISEFKYVRTDKVIHIYQCAITSILGKWWIEKLTRSELLLKRDPNTEVCNTLTLNRIY